MSQKIVYIFNQLNQEETQNGALEKLISKLKKQLAGGLFDNYDQHDCQEFLKVLIYQIHEENDSPIKSVTPKKGGNKSSYQELLSWIGIQKRKENSFVSQLFEGAFCSTITCLNNKCRKSVQYFEKFGDLTLDIYRQMSCNNLWKKQPKVNMETMVSNYFKEEIIDDFKCEKCKQKGISKKHEIVLFPQYLIVLVK